MEWIIILLIGVVVWFYYSKQNQNKNTSTTVSEQNNQRHHTKNEGIYLGNYNYYIDPDERLEFKQGDVALYQLNDGIWKDEAAGVLYLTQKKVILYDSGFSNIWTKLSESGDYPEQVYSIKLDDIIEVESIQLQNGLKGVLLKTSKGPYILSPSHRKYEGRVTPIANEYTSLVEFGEKLIKLKSNPEIDRLQQEIDQLQKNRVALQKQLESDNVNDK